MDDTYKVTPKLTINWGLSWEEYQPLKDKFGLQPNFQLKQPLPSYANEPDMANIRCWCGREQAASTKGWHSVSRPVQVARDGRLGDGS